MCPPDTWAAGVARVLVSLGVPKLTVQTKQKTARCLRCWDSEDAATSFSSRSRTEKMAVHRHSKLDKRTVKMRQVQFTDRAVDIPVASQIQVRTGAVRGTGYQHTRGCASLNSFDTAVSNAAHEMADVLFVGQQTRCSRCTKAHR